MSIQERTPPSSPEYTSRQYEYHMLDTPDKFVLEPFDQHRIEHSLAELSAMGFYGDANLEHALARKRVNNVDYTHPDNPATAELIRRVPGVEHWLELIPTPRALGPLYTPDMSALPNGHEIGDELRKWMIAIGDARGLRARVSMAEQLFTEKGQSNPAFGLPQRWLSLASGAAQSILNAAKNVADMSGKPPSVTLVDISSQALKDAQIYASDLAVDTDFTTERMNVLRRPGLDIAVRLGEAAMLRIADPAESTKLSRERLEPESYDAVEAIGILEYVKPEDWPYRYNKTLNLKMKQAGAVRFLKNAYRLVKPGGELVVGNMLDSHPQLGFTLNVVQWPHIQPRSVNQMMDIFDAAGLQGERHVYVPSYESQRVYALYRIHKPERES